MNQEMVNHAVSLGLDPSSRNFSFILDRAEKVAADIKIFENNIPKKISKCYGEKQKSVAYTLIKIQKDVINKNKSISIPSLPALAIASFSSIRQVQRTIRKLISAKVIHIREWRLIDHETGLVSTRIWNKKVNGKTLKIRVTLTDGKLRKMINPFAKVKEYITASKEKRRELVNQMTSKSVIAIKIINKFYERQPFKSNVQENKKHENTIPIDNLDFDWSSIE